MMYKQERDDIIEIGRRLYAKNYVAANDGNISIKVNSDEILITPSGVSKGYMKAEELLLVNLKGEVLSGEMKPSSEMKMHLEVYRKRDDIKAAVHAHPQKATAFAAARIVFDRIILPELVFTLGKVSLADYGTPTTSQVPQAVARCINDSDAVLLANHGALTVGFDVYAAYYKMETLEHFAAIYLNTLQLGGGVALDNKEIDTLYKIRSELFGIATPAEA